MPFGIRSPGEAEDTWGRDGNAHAVGNDGLVDDVAFVLVSWILPTDGIAHPMAQMHARISKAHTG